MDARCIIRLLGRGKATYVTLDYGESGRSEAVMQRHDWNVGIDLDNTLINYDDVILEIAREQGLVPPNFAGRKREIRDYIRSCGGELAWRELQARIYGPDITRAKLAPGAVDFIRHLRAAGAEVCIVSHKTTFSNLGKSVVNFRTSATEWLNANGLISDDLVPSIAIYYEDTREDKIARIIALRCTHFIDDLQEVFDDASFPNNVERILLSSERPERCAYPSYASFSEIISALGIDANR